jgi:hypothetical protein
VNMNMLWCIFAGRAFPYYDFITVIAGYSRYQDVPTKST